MEGDRHDHHRWNRRALRAVNILDWNLKVVQTTDLTWTEKDSNNLNICVMGDRSPLLGAKA
jgi:hypothetical protein